MERLTLLPGREAALRAGHPWVFRTDVHDLPETWPAGAEADVLDSRGQFLGRGLLSGGGQVVCRLYTRKREPLDRAFFRKRLLAAYEFRKTLNLPSKQTDSFRLVSGDGDRLPGLTVDRYADVLVVQTPTAGMDARREMLFELLQELFRPQAILERNDQALRKREGLPLRNGWLTAPREGSLHIREGGIVYEVDPLGAMKTGHFFDQRDNRLWLERLARGKDVLEVFCYTGGFGLMAAKHGAKRVLSTDGAAPALEAAKRNAVLNQVADRIEYRLGDGFDVLRELDREGRKFDLIVVDPPAFAKTQAQAEAAGRAYQEINARALKLLPIGGQLVTCSCSHHVSRPHFKKLLVKAAGDARRMLRLTAEGGAGRDHPVLLNVPQSDYLKSLLVTVVEKL